MSFLSESYYTVDLARTFNISIYQRKFSLKVLAVMFNLVPKLNYAKTRNMKNKNIVFANDVKCNIFNYRRLGFLVKHVIIDKS